MSLPDEIALATLKHLPEPFLLLDEDERVQFINVAGELLLDLTLDQVRYEPAKKILNLRDAHDLVHLETSATWVGDARLEFHVTQYPVAPGRTWLHLSMRYPSSVPTVASWPYRPRAHSEESFEHVQSGESFQRKPADDSFWQGKRLINILDRLPTVVAAVSKDGAHVYQNQAAFETLGSIRWNQDGLTTWLQRQWGSTHGDGTPFILEEYPIYRSAVLGEVVEDFETCFEGKSYLFMGSPQYDEDGNHIGGCVFAHDITSTKRQGDKRERDALESADFRFAAITDNMEQLVWKSNPDGEILHFNKRFYEYTGAGLEEALGSGWFNYVHADDAESVRANWECIMPDQDTFISQYRLRKYDGSYRWFLARARCLRNARNERETWFGTSTDITELTAALEEAKSTREHLLSITSAANVNYWVIEEDEGKLKLTSLFLSNDQNNRLYGYLDRDALLNHDVQKVLPESLISKVRLILSQQCDSERDEMLVGGEYWRTQLAPLRRVNEEGSFVLGVVGTTMDITNEKVKEQALQRADTARDVAVQSSTFKSEFLARMSHEIRTPIGGILGMAQLLADTSLATDQREYLEGISRSGDGLLIIINDILDFSKIEVGKLDIEALPFDLRLVVDDVLNGSRHGPHFRPEVDLRLDYDAPQDLVLLGDRNRVAQILNNLTSNALKFTHTGSVVMKVSLDSQPITAEYDSSTVVVKVDVIDTGLGIPADVLNKLFKPFTQADGTTCRRYGGTGLGLTIARQLATLMSGSLDLFSSGVDGEGSTARCIIPFRLCPQSTIQQKPDMQVTVDGGGAKILVVEDNKINQKIAITMLKKCNFVPRVANHGQEALDILHAGVADGSYIPDLILMDCQMPVLDGYQCTEILRRDVIARLREMPIIAMTASAIQGDRDKCLSSGMNDYISKPAKQAQLGATVMKWLNVRKLDVRPLNIAQNDDHGLKRHRDSSSGGESGEPNHHPRRI